MPHAASSENIHYVESVSVDFIIPENANCVSFTIHTEQGRKDMALFFENQPENAKKFYDALASIEAGE